MTDNIDFDFFDDPMEQDRINVVAPNHHKHGMVESSESSSNSELYVNDTQHPSTSKKSFSSSNSYNSRTSQASSKKSTQSSGLSKSKRRRQRYSDSSSTDEEHETVHISVNVHGKSPSVDTRHFKNVESKHIKNKPPLPSTGESYSKFSSKQLVEKEDSLNKSRTKDRLAKKKTQSKNGSKETSSVHFSSSDEEELQHVRLKPQIKGDPNLRLGLGDLDSPRSSSSTNSSRRNSSEWSTGSEPSDRESHRPHGRLSKRRSSSSESEFLQTPSRGRHSGDSKKRHRRSRSSDSSITVSSLSDSELPDRKSQSITSPSRMKASKSADSDRMSLEVLLSALLEADQNASESTQRKNVRIKVPEQPSHRASSQKANYTFTTDRSRLIDMENQRLLNSILAQRSGVSQQRTGPVNSAESMQTGAKPKSRRRVSPPRRVTNSTVNRSREQQRIERENLALLHRLNQIKPSAEISRNKCLGDYERQVAYHCPDMRLERDSKSRSYQGAGSRKQRPTSANYNRPSSAYGSMSRSSRPTSAATRPVSATTRPASATTRPTSATTHPASAMTRPVSATTRRPGIMGIKKRPEWQSGW
ncbi:cilia- and flagella-associated protein 97-like [Watersipora subatra]|uniref:cilia- and flagella-associated protein 97-like n=1 Tax=Watersipora subatra TaxID=2589382 RepID=UPI00355C908C